MKNILDYLEKREASPVFELEGKTYKIKKDYKLLLFLNEETKKLEEEGNSESSKADKQIKLMFKYLEMSINKDFVKTIESMGLSFNEITYIFSFIINRQNGMTEEEAAAEAQNNSKN